MSSDKTKIKSYKALQLVSIGGSAPIGESEIVTDQQYSGATLKELAKAGVLEEVKDQGDPEPEAEEPTATKAKSAAEKEVDGQAAAP